VCPARLGVDIRAGIMGDLGDGEDGDRGDGVSDKSDEGVSDDMSVVNGSDICKGSDISVVDVAAHTGTSFASFGDTVGESQSELGISPMMLLLSISGISSMVGIRDTGDCEHIL